MNYEILIERPAQKSLGTVEETYSGVWSVSEEWVYDWNPRDQMTRAMKWAGSSGSTNNVGSVEYQYCLACDGALSKRFVYGAGSGSTKGALESGQRYEYDGLNLLRVDELYGSTLSESGPWRTLEISTHQPGQLGALLHKRVYVHTNNDASPDQTKDFTYSYDPVGNVYSVFDGSGAEAYYFTQDAFGNELPITTLGGDDWNAARADRIVEHQTGKWIDGFTELYYFHARWYDSEVGRFVGRDPVRSTCGGESDRSLYIFCGNVPTHFVDATGTICTAGHANRAHGIYLCRRFVKPPGSFFGHCFIMEDCGGSCKTFSQIGPRNPGGITPDWDEDDGDIANCILIAPCSSCNTDCLKRASNSYSGDGGGYSNKPGNVENSNTAASCLLHKCNMGRPRSHKCSHGWARSPSDCDGRFNNPEFPRSHLINPSRWEKGRRNYGTWT